MISSRAELGEYCLVKLGKPVIKINVSDGQVNQRIDEAIQVWREKHYDATERLWLGYAITQEDLDNGYITLPPTVHVVDKIMALDSIYSAYSQDRLFGYRYQFITANLSPFQPMDMINYYLNMMSLSDMNDLVTTTERFEFTKHKRKLNIYRGFEDLAVGSIVCIHVYRYLDEAVDSDMWNDKWLKAYSTALIKQQFGQNMKKHGEIQLLGGVTVNGQQIFDEATTEIEKLEEQLTDTYQEPVDFFIG